MNIPDALIKVCSAQGAALSGLMNGEDVVSGGRMLLAIAGLESSFGERRLFVKMEAGYAPGGTYYRNSESVRSLWHTYGCLAASSYGSFQIMYVTAKELGFTGHPIDLQTDNICAYWATILIRRRIMQKQGANTLTQVLDAYNSGNAKDGNVPTDYIERGRRLYSDLHEYI